MKKTLIWLKVWYRDTGIRIKHMYSTVYDGYVYRTSVEVKRDFYFTFSFHFLHKYLQFYIYLQGLNTYNRLHGFITFFNIMLYARYVCEVLVLIQG
jgi:hypothetical protein